MSLESARSIYQILVHDLGKSCTIEELEKDKNHTWLLDNLRCPKEAGCRSILWSVQRNKPTLLVWLIDWKADSTSFMKAMRRTALDLLRHTRQTAMRDLKVVSDYTYWMDGEMLEDIRSTSTCLGVLQYNLKKGLTYDDHVGRLKPTILNKWKMEGRRFTIGQPLPGVVHRKQKKEEGDAHVLVLVTCTSSESGRNADLEDQEAVKEAIEIAGGTGLSRLLLGL